MAETIQNILEQNIVLLTQNRDLEKGNIEHLNQDKVASERRKQEALNQIYDTSFEERNLQQRLQRDSQQSYSNIFGKRLRASRQFNTASSERNQISGKIRRENKRLDTINGNLKQVPFQKSRLEELERQKVLNQARSEAQRLLSQYTPKPKTQLGKLSQLRN